MSSVTLAAQLVISGLSTGCLYALLAVGFTLIWKSAGVANFAQGDFATVGMFVAVSVYAISGGALPAALAAAIGAGCAVGMVVERAAIRPVVRADPLTAMLATLAVSIILSSGLQVIYGPMPRSLPAFLSMEAVGVGPVAVVPQEVGSAAIVVGLIAVLHAVYSRTMTGKALRALAENREIAGLMGVNRERMSVLAFGLSAALGATAGVLIAPFIFVTTAISFTLLMKALLAAVVGGFGSYPGALLGGLIIGVADNLSAFYVSSDYRDVLSFSLLIVVLLVRPAGLLGTARREI